MYCVLKSNIIAIAINCIINCTIANPNNDAPDVDVIKTSTNHPAIFRHAESPVWDPDTRNLYFVDVLNKRVHRYIYDEGVLETKQLAYGQVNIVMPIANSSRLLVGVRSALYVMNWDVEGDDSLRLLTQFDTGLPDNILNEAKADVKGRFWGGTKGPQSGDNVIPDKGTLYSLKQETFTHPEIKLRPVSISNGLVWSLNNSVLYYVDSNTKILEAFDFHLEKGEISNRRTITKLKDYGLHHAVFDGLTIDSEGFLWAALMFGGKVLRIDPDARKVVKMYSFPVSRITSLCWGGPNFDKLFVTTSRKEGEDMSGVVYILNNDGNKGVASNKFKFDMADCY